MQKTAVIIDDENHICTLIKTILSSFDIAILATAMDGKKGLEAFNQHHPDFVILDINLPDMSGMEALKKIKAIEKKAKIIILSAINDREQIQEAVENGADYYILKSNSAEDIHKYLQEYLIQS